MHPLFKPLLPNLRITCNLHWNLFGRQVLPRFVDRGASLIAEERTGLDEDALAFALLPLAAACGVRHCRILMLAQLRAV